MLSSFFWGYVCFQVVAGQLAKKYGPKYFIGTAKLIGSIFCALIPLFGAYFGYGGVMACRIITGMSQGFIFPCVHHLISAWAPLQDRAKIGSFAYAGKYMITKENNLNIRFYTRSLTSRYIYIYIYPPLIVIRFSSLNLILYSSKKCLSCL